MRSAAAIKKREVLQATTFGKPTAEEEAAALSTYFVETDQWQRMFAGDVDVVYGAKGSGKSALYSLLLSKTSELFDRGIIVVAAENPAGAIAFKDLVADPPTDEAEFRNLWKLYFLALATHTLRDYGISSPRLKRVADALEEARLFPRNVSLRGFLRLASGYVRRLMRSDAVALETTLNLHPATALPSGVSGRILFNEPTSLEESLGWVSVDHLLELVDAALIEARFSIWLVLDRLDVAFAESEDLERNALRALFRVYLDLGRYKAISLKIFLRSDLWMSILKKGFREASHISSQMTISWDESSLLNLVVRRALHNAALRSFYGIDAEETLADRNKQVEAFYRIFPRKVHTTEPLRTLDWMLKHTSDGSRQTAPRELIHLLSAARGVQLRRWEIGHAPPEGDTLFDPASLKQAVPEVARVRFQQTLCAEYPHLRERMLQLEGEADQHTAETLATIWRVNPTDAREVGYQLADIGFFQLLGGRKSPQFIVPLLYQVALKSRHVR